MNQLDRFERLVQRLIEGPFRRLFQTGLHPADLADQLAAVIETDHQNGQGSNLIPNHYQIMINPADYACLVERSSCEAIVTELYSFLISLAVEANYQFEGPLQVFLEPIEEIVAGHVQIMADIVPALPSGADDR